MSYFVLVYDRTASRLLDQSELTDLQAAMDERFRLEREYADTPDVEVAVIGASSVENLKVTHARFFETIGDLVGHS